MTTTATIEFHGNYGSFRVDAKTGFVVEHDPDWDAINDEEASDLGMFAAAGYTDIVRVDLEERARWYAEKGHELDEVQPNGDILDVGFWTLDMTYVGPEIDYREEIVLNVYEAN